MKYFLQRDGRTYGPYSYDDLKRYQAENRIGPNDMIRREDSQQWEPWQQVLNPAAALQQPPTPAPAPAPAQPASPAFGGGGFGGSPTPSAPAGQPPAFGGGFGQPSQPAPFQPPAEQGGFGGFGAAPQQPAASDVPGAFGAFGAQGGFGGSQPAPQGGGFGAPPQGGFGAPQGGFGAPAGGGFGAPAGGGFGGGAVGPMPPDMQWWLVLLIGMFTCGIFLIFWIWKQAKFVKQIDPSTDAPKFYGYALALYVGGYALAMIGAIAAAAMNSEIALVIPMVGQLVILGGAVCLILAAFKMRASIHNYYTTVEPMGINLMDTTGAVLTFFFSVYFFQYHFANIAARKKSMGHPAA